MSRRFRWRIIGLGNPLMGDDGVGVAAASRLQTLPLPPGVEVLDGGTGGLALLDLLADAEKVLLLDAAELRLSPGTIRLLPATAIAGPQGGTLSLHAAALADVLALGTEMDLLPAEILLLAVQPFSVEPRLGLSPLLEAALPLLLKQALTIVA